MRARGVKFNFTAIGKGRVVLNLPPEELLTTQQFRYTGPTTPRASNLRLANGKAVCRPGYVSYGDTPDTNQITGAYQALFDNGAVDTLRLTKSKVSKYNAGVWTNVTGAYTIGATDLDYWAFAMVIRAGGNPTRNQLAFTAGVANKPLYLFQAGASAITDVGLTYFSGAKVVVSANDRCVVANVVDDIGARRYQRVQFSKLGDGADFDALSAGGANFVDLTDDPYPIANMAVVGGRLCVYKGNNVGGGVVVGTPTGVNDTPYRWDTVNTSGIGLKCPRVMVPLPEGVVFVLGHDNFYLHDGARGWQAVAEEVGSTIINSINPQALSAAVAWYRPQTHEIVIGLPQGDATMPNEYWVFNTQERKIYGPWLYVPAITAAAYTARTDSVTWPTLPGGVPDIWPNLPFNAWTEIAGSATPQAMLYGLSNGQTKIDKGNALTDDGVGIVTEWRTPAIVPDGFPIIVGNNVVERVLEAGDVLSLREVVVTYYSGTAWTPAVQVSVDNGDTWTTISDGVALPAGSGLLAEKRYTCLIPGTWHQLRIYGSASASVQGISMEFTYVGDTFSGSSS